MVEVKMQKLQTVLVIPNDRAKFARNLTDNAIINASNGREKFFHSSNSKLNGTTRYNLTTFSTAQATA